MQLNDVYRTQTRVNDFAICIFSTFNEKMTANELENIVHDLS
jgi:hypothetical protein